MAGHERPRRAFTLVELLVVIAIIAVLVALLLPAVQAAREAGRRTKCKNNIRQLCLAMQNYHTLHKMFPINWGGSGTGDRTMGHSWLSMLLPQIEQRPLYDTIAFGKPLNHVDAARKQDNKLVAMTPVKTFRCASDTHEGTMDNQALSSGAAWAVTNYKACAGSNWGGLSGSVFQYRKSDANYGGRNASSYDGLDHGDGLICRGQGKPITTAMFQVQKDGSTNTFAVGEAVPGWCDWSAWYWYDGSTATCGIPLNYWKSQTWLEQKPDTPPQYNSNDKPNNYSFMSRHPDGANFGMCDASVHFISDVIDLAVYRGLATIDGGEPVEVPD